MKITNIFIALSVFILYSHFTFLSVHNQDLGTFLISKTIADICQKFFVENSIKFDIIVYGNSTHYIDEVTDRLLQLSHGNITINVKKIEDIDKWNHELDDSAVILMENMKFMDKFNGRAKLSSLTPKLMKFLIYSESYENAGDVVNVLDFQTDRGHVSSFEYFIVDNERTIDLIAIDNFMENNCDEFNMRNLNTFDKRSWKWIEELRNYQHFENFNGCMLTFTAPYSVQFHFNKYNREIWDSLRQQSNDTVTTELVRDILRRPDVGCRGFHCELFKMLGKRGNFVTNFKLSNGASQSGEKIFQRITIRNARYYEENMTSFAVTKLFLEATVGCFVTPSEFYTNFEKLLLPFDTLTWMMLAGTCCVITAIIFFMRFMPGYGINTPALNVARILFGIGQTRLPRESISRFILVLFVMLCLVLRTCYKSKMFDFITTDMRKPPPKTFDEVIERNYTFVVTKTSALYQDLVNIIRERDDNTNIEAVEDGIKFMRLYCKSINDHSPKLAFLFITEEERRFRSLCKGSLIPVKNFPMNPIPVGLRMASQSILQPIFDDVMDKIIPSGIPQHLDKFYATLLFGGYERDNVKIPKVLTLDDLSFGFILWLIACGICLVAFLVEFSFGNVRRFLRIVTF